MTAFWFYVAGATGVLCWLSYITQMRVNHYPPSVAVDAVLMAAFVCFALASAASKRR